MNLEYLLRILKIAQDVNGEEGTFNNETFRKGKSFRPLGPYTYKRLQMLQSPVLPLSRNNLQHSRVSLLQVEFVRSFPKCYGLESEEY